MRREKFSKIDESKARATVRRASLQVRCMLCCGAESGWMVHSCLGIQFSTPPFPPLRRYYIYIVMVGMLQYGQHINMFKCVNLWEKNSTDTQTHTMARRL